MTHSTARRRHLAAFGICSHMSPIGDQTDYYVVMVEHGHRGREAVVDPELTRSNVIDRLRSGEYGEIAFIHRIHGGECTVVTAELLAEAGVVDPVSDLSPRDRRLLADIDRGRDNRKNWEA